MPTSASSCSASGSVPRLEIALHADVVELGGTAHARTAQVDMSRRWRHDRA